MTYARARLWLGISCVGTLVLLSLFGLTFNVPSLVLSTTVVDAGPFLLELLGFFAFAYLILSPFELLGGFGFPREFKRIPEDTKMTHFLTRVTRASSIQVLIFLLGTTLLALSFQIGGYLMLAGVTVLLALLGIHIQTKMSRWASGINYQQTDLVDEKLTGEVIVATSNDQSFTGGITGAPWRPKVVIPKHWFDLLSKDEIDAVIERRLLAVSSRSRFGGVVVSTTFLVVGICLSFLLTTTLNGLSPLSPAGIATIVLWNILWGFLGLLTLPTLSRFSSQYVDQLYINQHGRRDHAESATQRQQLLNSAFQKIETLSDDEPMRSQWLETIFHPIPARELRDVNKRSQEFDPKKVSMQSSSGGWKKYAWHCLRTYLYQSWFVGGLLSRAVHCNVGKPDLWVFLPSD